MQIFVFFFLFFVLNTHKHTHSIIQRQYTGIAFPKVERVYSDTHALYCAVVIKHDFSLHRVYNTGHGQIRQDQFSVFEIHS